MSPETERPSCSTAPTGPRGVGPATGQSAAPAAGQHIQFWVVDANKVAAEASRQPDQHSDAALFLRSFGILPAEKAVEEIKGLVTKAYGKRGRTIVERNFVAIDAALAAWLRWRSRRESRLRIRSASLSRVRPGLRSACDLDAHGRSGRTSCRVRLPADGRFPSGTASLREAGLSRWRCQSGTRTSASTAASGTIVCPHAVIRMKVFPPKRIVGLLDGFLSKPFVPRISPDTIWPSRWPLTTAPAAVSVSTCARRSPKTEAKHKSINMETCAREPRAAAESLGLFPVHPGAGPLPAAHDSVKGSQAFSHCSSSPELVTVAGETPYLKLASQLFGDRMLVAMPRAARRSTAATCRRLRGHETPKGRGPGLGQLTVRGNAEFGLGIGSVLEAQQTRARALLVSLSGDVGQELPPRSWTPFRMRRRPCSPSGDVSPAPTRSWAG